MIHGQMSLAISSEADLSSDIRVKQDIAIVSDQLDQHPVDPLLLPEGRLAEVRSIR